MSEEQNIPGKENELSNEDSSAEQQQEGGELTNVPETQISTPKIKAPMEVHHHGHVHHEKKWKEYLFQFFMLFLAVFCGFLAEYQLEHIIENKREKQFMESLVKDLALDTLQFDRIRASRIRSMQRMDSSILYYSSNVSNSVPFKVLKFGGVALRTFYQNSGTLDQLKHAGGLRLIRKRNVVDSIEAYDQQIKRMVLRDASETQIVIQNQELSRKLYDGQALIKIHVDTTFYHQPPPSLDLPVPINKDYLGEYLNSIISCRNSYEGNLDLQNSIKLKAKNLIQLIKEEYHLEKE